MTRFCKSRPILTVRSTRSAPAKPWSACAYSEVIVVKYTTKTGRALPHGRTTRRSKLVRTRSRGQERPLPLNMQCHPQALTPTPRNPQCFSTDWVRAHYACMPDNRQHYIEGRGLTIQGPWTPHSIEIEGKIVGWCADAAYGL